MNTNTNSVSESVIQFVTRVPLHFINIPVTATLFLDLYVLAVLYVLYGTQFYPVDILEKHKDLKIKDISTTIEDIRGISLTK